jgi:hypothetical protein
MGEDDYGVWLRRQRCCRACQRRDSGTCALQAGVSGRLAHHRRGRLELIAACSVNVPGFPITRTAAGFREGKQVSPGGRRHRAAQVVRVLGWARAGGH